MTIEDMIAEVLDWGLKPNAVTTDAWYASRENLKFLKNKGLGFFVGVAKNRSCSLNGQDYTQIQNLEIPNDGLIVYLKNFGKVKVFRKNFKNEETRYYIIFVPDEDALTAMNQVEFKTLHSIHWGIECYHRAIKQVCGIEHFMVRTTEAIHTHFFSAIRAFIHLELMRAEELIENWYQIQRKLSLQVARDFILEHLKQKLDFNAHNHDYVNA